MNPKGLQLNIVVAVAAAAALSFFASCAEMESTNTKSLLSSAGFHTVTPSTPLQKEVYAHLTANHVQRVTIGERKIYAFKDEQAGIAYVGREAEYQRYVHLCVQQRVAQDYYTAYSMDPYWSHRWYGAYGYGYRGRYW
jgi:hypothetical protein